VAEPRLRAFLLIAAAGAVLVLIDVAGTAGALVGLSGMILGTVVTGVAAPAPGSPEVNWWSLVAAGTALTAVGVPLSLGLETVGGLIAAAGGVLVVVGAALGFP
jgi:glucose dehydrogenase